MNGRRSVGQGQILVVCVAACLFVRVEGCRLCCECAVCTMFWPIFQWNMLCVWETNTHSSKENQLLVCSRALRYTSESHREAFLSYRGGRFAKTQSSIIAYCDLLPDCCLCRRPAGEASEAAFMGRLQRAGCVRLFEKWRQYWTSLIHYTLKVMELLRAACLENVYSETKSQSLLGIKNSNSAIGLFFAMES